MLFINTRGAEGRLRGYTVPIPGNRALDLQSESEMCQYGGHRKNERRKQK